MSAGFDDDELQEAIAAERQEAIRRLLEWLTTGADAQEAGRRALTVAYLVRAPGAPDSQRALAGRLGLSVGGVNALAARIRRQTGLSRLRH